MILKIMRFILGYVYVEIHGFAPERLMNLILDRDIIIWNIETLDHGFRFCIGRKSLLDIKPLLKKTNMKLTIKEKVGLPYSIKRHKKRCFFLLGLGCCVLVLYMLSLFIWDIRVDGENDLVKEELICEIKEKYIPLGTRKAQVNLHSVEESLRKDYETISWISAEIKGTVLYVHLNEGVNKENVVNTQPGNLIANYDCTVTKIITRTGIPMVKKGAKVNKGDQLISGTIYLYDDNQEIIETDYVCADGDIWGQLQQPYEDSQELVYYDKCYDTHKKKYYELNLFGRYFIPLKPSEKAGAKYDYFIDHKNLTLFSSFVIPIGYQIIHQKEYHLEKKVYTKEEAKNLLNKRLSKKIKELQQKKVEIIENNVKIVEDDGIVRAKGQLIINQPIASYQKINTFAILNTKNN